MGWAMCKCYVATSEGVRNRTFVASHVPAILLINKNIIKYQNRIELTNERDDRVDLHMHSPPLSHSKLQTPNSKSILDWISLSFFKKRKIYIIWIKIFVHTTRSHSPSPISREKLLLVYTQLTDPPLLEIDLSDFSRGRPPWIHKPISSYQGLAWPTMKAQIHLLRILRVAILTQSLSSQSLSTTMSWSPIHSPSRTNSHVVC